jgi:hypothetical protein
MTRCVKCNIDPSFLSNSMLIMVYSKKQGTYWWSTWSFVCAKLGTRASVKTSGIWVGLKESGW